MFTAEHFIWIGICALLISALTYLSLKLKFSFRTSAWVMAGIALVSEITKICSDMEFVNGIDVTEGMVLDAGSLPFHLCSLFVFAFLYLPFSKDGKFKRFLLNLAVPVGLMGATLAILMATSGTDFSDIDSYQCFLYHAGMIWFSIYLLATKQVDLGKRSWLVNMGTLFVLAICMLWLNSILQVYDTNFWFVVRPPVDGLPLLNLDHGWFAYFGVLLFLGFLGVTGIHLPFMLSKKHSEKEIKTEE